MADTERAKEIHFSGSCQEVLLQSRETRHLPGAQGPWVSRDCGELKAQGGAGQEVC